VGTTNIHRVVSENHIDLKERSHFLKWKDEMDFRQTKTLFYFIRNQFNVGSTSDTGWHNSAEDLTDDKPAKEVK
jgi:hypothetical protein